MAVNWNEISNKIVIEGEAEYKKAMADINRALREAKSEMKAAAAEYDANSDSVDALKASMDALQSVEAGQNLALATMEKHLKKVEETTGKSSREAVELRTKINNLRAEITRTGNDLQRFETRMKDAQSAMGDVDGSRAADAIGDMADKAADAEAGVGSMLSELGKVAGIDLGNLAGIGALAAAGKFTLEIAQKGVDSAVEQTQARGQIAAYTGATGADLEALTESGKAVYREGFGESLKEASQHVATVYSYTGAMGEALEAATMTAMRLDDVFGMDVPESARTARQMMNQFGLSVQDAYALIASGAQEGADKNGNLLDTLNEYAPYYAKAGKSAEEFMGTLISGAQSGVYDVDKIGDAMKEFTIRVTDGSEATKEALKGLGLEAVDVPGKFAMGGETASAAFDLIIDKLMAVQDPLTQNQLGIALFGTQWEDTGGAVLEIFDQISGSAADAGNALDALNETRTDDLEVAADRVGRRIEEGVGEAFEPLATAAAHGLNAVADAMDEFDAKREEARQAAADAEAYALSQTQSMYDELDAINTKIKEADLAGDFAEAARLMQERDALRADIAEMTALLETEYEQMGEDAAAALESTDAAMEAAGETVGEAGVMGLEDGLEDMEETGEAAADGAVAGALSRESAMYSAGARLGGAFRKGFRTEMQIHSPSRAAMEDMSLVTDGYMAQAEADAQRMRTASAALAGALREGFTASPDGTENGLYGAGSGTGGLTAEAIGRAAAQAMTGMGVYLGAERVGEVIEQPVSRATTRRAMGTIRGQSARMKNWR